jgi:hypothetical protein
MSIANAAIQRGHGEPAGWVIMVGTLPEVRYFDVAIVDADAAAQAVRKVQHLGSDVTIQISARLDREFLTKFGIAAGEIRRR